MSNLNESTVEDAALEYLAQLGYQTAWGPNLAPGEPGEERTSFDQIYLHSRLRSALRRINAGVDGALIDEAIKRLGRAESQNAVAENFRVHKLVTEGVPVEHRGADGAVRTVRIWLVDYNEPTNNDWVAINQFTIIEGGKNRRPDVIVFVNGIPLGLLELKNPTDEHATLKGAWNQLQTYRKDIPSLFTPNAVAVVSDGTSAAMSSFTGGFEHFAPWKTVDGREVVTNLPALEVLIKGIFDQRRLLDIVRNFVVFSEETVSDKRPVRRSRRWSSGSRSITNTGRSTLRWSRRSRLRVSTATGVGASCGTRRDQARVSKWCSTPRRSCVIPACRPNAGLHHRPQ